MGLQPIETLERCLAVNSGESAKRDSEKITDIYSKLVELSNKRLRTAAASYIGQVVDGVLFEAPERSGLDYYLTGHAKNYFRVISKVDHQEIAERHSQTVGKVRIRSVAEKASLEYCLEGDLVS